LVSCSRWSGRHCCTGRATWTRWRSATTRLPRWAWRRKPPAGGLYLAASLLAAATVAAVGLVGFVGLLVPHMARSLVGARHRAVLAVSALAGSTLVVGADLAARTARAPAELPLGAVTAMVGVPFFLSLLRRMR
jgi:ABC-type cobalamin transport system permease subunit